MFRLLAMGLLALFSTLSWSQSLVVSTQPIYLIAKKITQGVEQPTLLLANQSGHDVSLTPAHRKIIQDAGLVIWLGQAHEAPLAKVLNDSHKGIAILESGILTTLPMRNPRGEALKNTVDTHVWLDPNNAVRIGFFIAALRSQQLPENRELYWKNARDFAQSMFATAQRYSSSTKAKAYWSYHDAYQYLERPLNLKFMGALTDDPHVSPTVAQIKFLQDHRPQPKMCLLAEGHASENQYRKLKPV
ncbi:MAG: zinc ABC transporter substrate-binding protein, partial [Gammaproteobacteria bacterium]|nr:zinc ABC transporter substrate-binding protein [Gammaproteobacteria bacterium]